MFRIFLSVSIFVCHRLRLVLLLAGSYPEQKIGHCVIVQAQAPQTLDSPDRFLRIHSRTSFAMRRCYTSTSIPQIFLPFKYLGGIFAMGSPANAWGVCRGFPVLIDAGVGRKVPFWGSVFDGFYGKSWKRMKGETVEHTKVWQENNFNNQIW